MVIAAFTKDRIYATATGLWQWDYGQVLRIQGLSLPSAVEVHFSLQEKGGEAIPRIGVTKDGITDVLIPDSMLKVGTPRDYAIYAFIYLADESSGQTEYKIRMTVQARPKPQAPEEDSTFGDIMAAVQQLASGKVDSNQGEENAGKYMGVNDAGRVVPVDDPDYNDLINRPIIPIDELAGIEGCEIATSESSKMYAYTIWLNKDFIAPPGIVKISGKNGKSPGIQVRFRDATDGTSHIAITDYGLMTLNENVSMFYHFATNPSTKNDCTIRITNVLNGEMHIIKYNPNTGNYTDSNYTQHVGNDIVLNWANVNSSESNYAPSNDSDLATKKYVDDVTQPEYIELPLGTKDEPLILADYLGYSGSNVPVYAKLTFPNGKTFGYMKVNRDAEYTHCYLNGAGYVRGSLEPVDTEGVQKFSVTLYMQHGGIREILFSNVGLITNTPLASLAYVDDAIPTDEHINSLIDAKTEELGQKIEEAKTEMLHGLTFSVNPEDGGLDITYTYEEV